MAASDSSRDVLLEGSDRRAHQRLLLGLPSRRRIRLTLLKLSDLSAILLAFSVATLLVAVPGEVTPLKEFLALRLKVVNFSIFLGLILFWHVGFSALGLYEDGRPAASRKSAVAILKATTLATLAASACAVPFGIDIITAPFLVAFWSVSTLAMIGFRRLLTTASKLLGNGTRGQRSVVIAGTGARALAYARQLQGDPEHDDEIVAFVDAPWDDPEHFPVLDGRYYCNFDKFPAFLRDNVVDEIVVALPLQVLADHRARLLGACEEHGVTVRFLSSVLTGRDDPMSGSGTANSVVVTLYHGAEEGWPVVAKRAIDVSISASALVVLAPFLLGIGLLVRLTSPGPALFSQERIGINKRRFRMRKFRTMAVDAEQSQAALEHLNEVEGAAFKIEKDPRVTRFGHFLRTTSLDELPQLWNVLVGEMSLVGPRPLPLRDFRLFDQDRHRRRFSVRPGVTGLSQVSGRSSISFEDWMQLDLQYIDEWSLGKDFRILARTVPAVVKRVGAR